MGICDRVISFVCGHCRAKMDLRGSVRVNALVDFPSCPMCNRTLCPACRYQAGCDNRNLEGVIYSRHV